MKKALVFILSITSYFCYAQKIERVEKREFNEKGIVIKEDIRTTGADGETVNLKGVTFGLGMGWSYMFKQPKEYFLTTDTNHKLQVQDLSHSSIVLSSMISIKLGKWAIQDQKGKDGKIRKAYVNPNKTKDPTKGVTALSGDPAYEDLKWYQRFAINISLNLAEINGGNIAFNKSIDGGLGLGYYFNEFTQVALFYDMLRVRQMRDYFVKNYEGQAIPNGTEVYNALDEKDNNLFYNKYYSGLSLKVIFSFGNK